MNLRFEEKRELAPRVWEYRFKPETLVEYVPGQYARFTFPFHIDDPHGQQHRTFSLTSHPSEPNIRFITRLDEPMSLYKQHLATLQPGSIMHIDEPHGDAVLPRLATTPLVFVAQGIAIASYLSILNECARSDLSHPITLFWARRSEEDRLETLIPGETPHLTRLDRHYPSRLTSADIVPQVQRTTLVYLSGGQWFVETLGAGLEAAGIPRERIIYDYYEGYVEL